MEIDMKEIFDKYGISLSEQQEGQLKQYYDLLVEWNKKINLTSILEYEEVIWKHFLDSSLIMLSEEWKKEDNTKVMDVGTGAGFPGMVLAILNQKKRFVLLDSLNKRIEFLNLVKKELKLENVEIYHGRAEVFGRKEEFRNQFDIVVSRAVAELPILMEYCIPFVKKEGYFISYKGKKQKEEIESSENAFSKLSSSFVKAEKYELRENEKRYLLFIKNNEITDGKYPRKEGKPKKKPL